jgi:D-alanyl-lipoteichoic acid acyltransferase DltB (MBOAT superfamily)
LLRFVTFLTFFPQLVAGPIVRRAELLPQLISLPSLARGQVGSGLYRIGRGMLKKVLLADIVRVGVVDPIFAEPSRFTSLELLVGLYAYTLQIYYDFSGYTDIALGSAKLFGIELPENFRRPYKATSVAGFWRRWHITLSNWVRDYIYYPLGGARVKPQARIYFNIMATLLIIGIWHGASWNFVAYGLLHGAAVAINRVMRARTGRRPDDPLPGWWGWLWRFLLTFHFVVLARILFRSPDFATSWVYLLGLLEGTFVMPRFSMLAWAMLAVGYIIHFSPESWQARLEKRFSGGGPLLWVLGLAAVTALCMLLGTGEQLAFIYYQF